MFETALTKAGLTWVNDTDNNYIKSITKDGITLTEKQYGVQDDMSGWMYTLNGVHSGLGVNEQFLTDGDCILFHWTDDGAKEGGVTGPAVKSMSITTASPTVKAGEKTDALNVSFTPALLNGNVRCEWKSSDTSIATVDQKGIVTGIAEGEATITATAAGKSAEVKVTVEPGEAPVIAVESVSIAPASLTLKPGETGNLTATITPSNATAQTVQWSSSDNSVASVSSSGVVTAKKVGDVTITAEAGGKSAEIPVKVEAEKVVYTDALNAVLPYIKSAVAEPGVGSTYGEWAVFALKRGGYATGEDWDKLYLADLSAHLDKKNGILSPYTDYSRIVLALTSMGYDATKFKTEKATYDLVSPLLDKQTDGVHYMAEKQGNNGTAFALLALDSHNYLDTAEGKATRARLIASLKANQKDSGEWPISGDLTSIDVTAAAVYALAPYYLDSAKLTALGGSVTYDQLKAMVDKALAWLSTQQGTDGGFGSPEADGWVVIALSTLGRDAATDKAFVKAGGSVLDDLLRYYDENTGGFKHDITSIVNQMASEQAAYDLVAYDRFKNSKKALYDMSDVTLMQNEAVSGGSGSGSGEGGSGGGGGTTPTDNTITVTMRLIGAEKSTKDVDLGATPTYLPNYVTWIATTPYTLEEGALVYDLWTTATAAAGIESEGANRNYVKSVTAPSGYELAEFTNGPRSGWMYTLNGSHPNLGLKEQELHDGDVVIWHYVNDYSYEVSDWFDEARWPSLATDDTYYSLWLKAPDYVGGKGGGIGGSSDGGSSTSSGDKKDDKADDKATEPVAETSEVTVAPEVTEGEAKATVTEDTISEALKDAESVDVLTVKVDTEDADSVELALDADAVKAAAEADVDLHVETEVGTIKVDSNTLNELADSGKDIAVTVTANDDGTTTLNVTVDGESVDAKVKVELPAADEGQVLVIVNTDGTETVVKKSLVEDGKAYAEIPAGATVKVVEGESIEFGDVADSAWYAEAVEFVASHELFQGTDNGFEPETTMNCAMLAMVLYRLEDATATGNSNFPDVSDDAWYAEAVAWASETGIVNGTGKGFEPNAPVTREQIATMLYRYANVIGLDTGSRGELSSFPDGGETSDWAQDAMAWAVSVGLFQGDDTGALNPKGDATRAQVATLFERMIGLIVK